MNTKTKELRRKPNDTIEACFDKLPEIEYWEYVGEDEYGITSSVEQNIILNKINAYFDNIFDVSNNCISWMPEPEKYWETYELHSLVLDEEDEEYYGDEFNYIFRFYATF